jgi:hypothetical protein
MRREVPDMSILLEGRKFQTLEQPIYVNGKLLKEARVNGQIVYPTETYGNFAHFGYIRGVGEYVKQVYFMTEPMICSRTSNARTPFRLKLGSPVTMRVRYAYCWLFDHRKTLGLPNTAWRIFNADSASAYIIERDGKKNLEGGDIPESYASTWLPEVRRSIPGLFNDGTMKAASVVLKMKLEFDENPIVYGASLTPVGRHSDYRYDIRLGDQSGKLKADIETMKGQHVYTFAYVSPDAGLPNTAKYPLVGSLRNNRTFPIVGMVGDSDTVEGNDLTASHIHFAQGPLGYMNVDRYRSDGSLWPAGNTRLYMGDYFSHDTTGRLIDKETARIPIGDDAYTNVTHTTQTIMDVSPVWVYLYKNEKHGLTTPELAYAHVDDVPDF